MQAKIIYHCKYLMVIVGMLLFHTAAAAHLFSYIYIQGDKVVPFYVKLEGKMQPRYGKNYCIIAELDPGPIHIEILFQQRMLPPRQFTIQVPENGGRGFLLSKDGDEYKLYDLEHGKYLGPNDK